MIKNHKPWTITAKAGGEIEILLYEMIGTDFWTGEGTTAKSFAEDLKAAGPVTKIHLRVNSPGGAVFDGLAIYNTLLSHGAKVTAQVDGLAASIASVIVMAASEISMGENAIMMIHNPYTSVGGDANDMRKMAETLDKVKASMIPAYRRHTKKSAEEVAALMDAETWMTAQETVDLGFAEKVITPEGDDADVAANFAPMLAKFRKVPQQIAARFAPVKADEKGASECGCSCLPCSKENNCQDCTNADCADEDCTDCAMQALAFAKAKAKKIKADEKGAEECGCECLPCSKENNCQDCANADCMDDDCEDCPMQAKAKATASLKQQIDDANKTIRSLNAKLTQLEEEKKGVVAEKKTDADASARWMQRIAAELEEGSKLAAALKDLPRFTAATRESIVALTMRLEMAEGDLAAERKAHAEDAQGHAQWIERTLGEFRQASAVYAAAMEELPRLLAASVSRCAEIQGELERAQASLVNEKRAHAQYCQANMRWIESLVSEIKQASEVCVAASDDLPRRSRTAEVAADGLLSDVAEAEAAAGAAKESREKQATAHMEAALGIQSKLGEARNLLTTAMEEMPRRARMAEAKAGQLQTPAAKPESNKLTEEATARLQDVERIHGDLERAAALYASAGEEISRRVRMAAL
jgi:ATP-dependent Clp endopeptidase proteolytic subunit ClpP